MVIRGMVYYCYTNIISKCCCFPSKCWRTATSGRLGHGINDSYHDFLLFFWMIGIGMHWCISRYIYIYVCITYINNYIITHDIFLYTYILCIYIYSYICIYRYICVQYLKHTANMSYIAFKVFNVFMTGTSSRNCQLFMHND